MDLAHTLGSDERLVLSVLKRRLGLEQLMKQTGLPHVRVTRALQWLSNKGLVRLERSASSYVELGGNGARYLKSGLPERIFLECLRTGRKSPAAIPLNKDELQVSIGVLKRQAAIRVLKPLSFELTEQGTKLLEKSTLEEKFLQTLASPRPIAELKSEEKLALERLLLRRDVVRVREKRALVAFLTEKGRKLGKLKAVRLLGRLTPQQIVSGDWRSVGFKAYDIRSPVPAIRGATRHLLYQVVEYIRRIWLDMGFKEMSGRLVQQSFWNFDALFTAQDHPVRDIHDTFFIKEPSQGSLPFSKLVSRVKQVHEDGWTTGSKGWGYRWSPEVAKRNCMRTHTTVLSARTLAALTKDELPGKFFSVARCFRNETIDWGHSFEFYQIEGIVVSKEVNFTHLLGYLREYYKKLGYHKVRFRPAYFPYTEMSVESEVYLKDRHKWVETGGAGILRPEVVKPLLGVDLPVLAWGQGLERGIMEHLGISDLREVYSNDLAKPPRIWYR